MGYDPPPPPPRAYVIPRIEDERPRRRKRRHRIEVVPTSTNQKIGVGMEVVAADCHGERWEWRTFITFDGGRSFMGYSFSSWRRPSPYEVRGRARDEGRAWDAAREAANDARARFVAEQVRGGRKHKEHVPL